VTRARVTAVAVASLGAMGMLATACDTGGPSGGGAGAPLDAGGFVFDFGRGPDDAGELDAAVPPPPLPDPAACAATCETLSACAAADAPDGLCDAIDAREREAFAGLCAQVCGAAPGFPEAFAGVGDCPAQLERMRAVSSTLAYACVPSPPPETPACAVFADRTAACTGEACDDVVPVQAGLAYWLRLSCDQSVAAGQLTVDDLARLPGEQTPCDDPVAQSIVGGLVGDATRQGTLTHLCTFGPALDEGTCAAACEHLRPCLPPRNPLRVESYCRFVCALDDSLRDPLTCAAAAPECAPLSTCFGG
jgi:hypothetical protein